MNNKIGVENQGMIDFDLVTNPYAFCCILIGQFVFYSIFTVYLERKNTILKEKNWPGIFNFRNNNNQQGFSNLHEGFLNYSYFLYDK